MIPFPDPADESSSRRWQDPKTASKDNIFMFQIFEGISQTYKNQEIWKEMNT